MVWFKHKKIADELTGDEVAKEFFDAHVVVGKEPDGRLQFQPKGKVGIEYPIYWGTCVHNLTGYKGNACTV